jgi:hypothetical protein
MFPSFEAFKGSRDESEVPLQSKQGLVHVKETNDSQDCSIQTNVEDQPIEASYVGIGARIGTSNVDKLY